MADQFSRDVISDGVRGHGNNIVLGALFGIIAAAIGAAIWMGLTVATNMHLGIVAIGIGALVGFAIRLGGNGTTIIFGIMGAILTFLSCLAGEVLVVLQAMSSPEHSIFQMLGSVDYTALIPTIMEHTTTMSYIIYGIGIYEGFKLSIKN